MKQRDVIFFLVSICIVVFVWIAFTIIHISQTSTISDETTQTIQPIAGKFDTSTIQAMNKKIPVNSENTIHIVSPTETTLITQAPLNPTVVAVPTIASASSQTATQGGSTH